MSQDNHLEGSAEAIQSEYVRLSWVLASVYAGHRVFIQMPLTQQTFKLKSALLVINQLCRLIFLQVFKFIYVTSFHRYANHHTWLFSINFFKFVFQFVFLQDWFPVFPIKISSLFSIFFAMFLTLLSIIYQVCYASHFQVCCPSCFKFDLQFSFAS